MEWQIIQVIVYVVSFLVTVVGFGIKLSNVIQKNTNAINNLSEKLKELTEDNRKDHESFFKSINSLKIDVAILQEKHESDIKLMMRNNKKE